jgi:hypothetical protein
VTEIIEWTPVTGKTQLGGGGAPSAVRPHAGIDPVGGGEWWGWWGWWGWAGGARGAQGEEDEEDKERGMFFLHDFFFLSLIIMGIAWLPYRAIESWKFLNLIWTMR